MSSQGRRKQREQLEESLPKRLRAEGEDFIRLAVYVEGGDSDLAARSLAQRLKSLTEVLKDLTVLTLLKELESEQKAKSRKRGIKKTELSSQKD